MLRTSGTPHTGGTRTSAAECKGFHLRLHRGTNLSRQSKSLHAGHDADTIDAIMDPPTDQHHQYHNAARDASARQHQRIRDLAFRMAMDAREAASQSGYNANVFRSNEPLTLPHTELRPPPAHEPRAIRRARKWTYEDVLARLQELGPSPVSPTQIHVDRQKTNDRSSPSARHPSR